MKTLKLVLGLALSCFAFHNHSNAQQEVQVTFENLQPADGFYLTPVFASFHDGSFDVFDAGTAASVALERVAEDGMFADIQSDFTANGVGQQSLFTSPGGFPGAPLFDPGESVSQIFNLDTNSRFLNLAAMLLPTNDNFIGNDNAIAILDAAGVFNGNQTFDLSLTDVYDAGTEDNTATGLPFSPVGGTDTATIRGTVSSINPATDLAIFDGLATAAGTNIDLASALSSPLLRVTITAVPEPSSLALLGICSMAAVTRRRR